MKSWPKAERIVLNTPLPVAAKSVGATQRSVNDAFDLNLNLPLRLYATFPFADSKLNIAPSQIPSADGSARSLGPIGTVTPQFPLSSIDFQTGAIVGGPVSITFPASTVGQFRRCAFALDNTGTLVASFSAEAGSVGALPDPATLYASGSIQRGHIDLECTDVLGKFKTAGSVTSVIESAVGGVARIVQLAGSGGGAGGGSANAGVAQEVAIGSGLTTITVTFPTPLSGTNYVPLAQMVNIVDAFPQFQTVAITAKTTNGFTAVWNAPTDSANYKLDYLVPTNQTQLGEAAVGSGVDSIVIALPISLAGTSYSITAQLVNYVDAAPQFQTVVITAKSGASFTANWNAPTDSGNYRLAYQIANFT